MRSRIEEKLSLSLLEGEKRYLNQALFRPVRQQLRAREQSIDQETIVVRTYPVRWNAPNRRAVVQPRMQISKLQTYRHTSSEQIQACRPAGVKNYMLADVFMCFFSSFFSFLLCLFLILTKKNTQGYRHTGIEQYKTCCLFFSNETQA